MTRFVKSWLGLAARPAALALGDGRSLRAEKELVFGLQCDRTGPTATVGVGAVPRLPRLHRAGEQQGRRRGLQDQGHRDRQRIQGAAGDRGARALQEGGRGARGPLRHAADRGAEQEARGGQDPRHLAGLRHGGGGRRQALPVHLPDRGQLLVAGRRGGRVRQGEARRQPEGQEDRLPVLRQSRRARSRCRSSRISPRARASSCAPSRCRAPGVEMGAQVLDITSASSRTSSSPTCSAARRRSRSRSSRARAIR